MSLCFGTKRPVLADHAWTGRRIDSLVQAWAQRRHNEGTSLREDAGYDEKC